MPETFVLDCSVAAKWVLHEPDREFALTWFGRYVSGEILLIAPDLLLAEFASLLEKRHRRKQITPEQAQEAYRLMTRCGLYRKCGRWWFRRWRYRYNFNCRCGMRSTWRWRRNTTVRF
jgi:hypothetical protein